MSAIPVRPVQSTEYRDVLCSLIRSGLVAGQEAKPQDWQDALRFAADRFTAYSQLGDEGGVAMAEALITALLQARKQPLPCF